MTKYTILALTREDVAEVVGSRIAERLTDWQMGQLARRLGDAYAELAGFYDILEDVVEWLLPQWGYESTAEDLDGVLDEIATVEDLDKFLDQLAIIDDTPAE